jgi:hypothetical protein
MAGQTYAQRVKSEDRVVVAAIVATVYTVVTL